MPLCPLGCPSTLFYRSLGSWQGKDKKETSSPALGLLMPGPAAPGTASGALKATYKPRAHNTFILFV